MAISWLINNQRILYFLERLEKVKCLNIFRFWPILGFNLLLFSYGYGHGLFPFKAIFVDAPRAKLDLVILRPSSCFPIYSTPNNRTPCRMSSNAQSFKYFRSD